MVLGLYRLGAVPARQDTRFSGPPHISVPSRDSFGLHGIARRRQSRATTLVVAGSECPKSGQLPHKRPNKKPAMWRAFLSRRARLFRLVVERLTDQLADLGLKRLGQCTELDLNREAIGILGNRAGVLLAGKELVDTSLAR